MNELVEIVIDNLPTDECGHLMELTTAHVLQPGFVVVVVVVVVIFIGFGFGISFGIGIEFESGLSLILEGLGSNPKDHAV